MMIIIPISPLSVNKAWQGQRYKTKDYKIYEEVILWQLPNNYVVPEGDLVIYLEFGMSNKLSDWDNPIKPFVDILQKKYDFNDNRIVEANVKKVKVLKGKEYIKFSF